MLNVHDFGAVGNGVTDDSSSIQSAINAAQASKGDTVFFPNGTYAITQTLTITGSNVVLLGAGSDITHSYTPTGGSPAVALLWTGSAGGTMVDIRGVSTAPPGATATPVGNGVRGISFYSNGAAGYGLRTRAGRGYYADLTFDAFSARGLDISGTSYTEPGGVSHNTYERITSTNYTLPYNGGIPIYLDGESGNPNKYDDTTFFHMFRNVAVGYQQGPGIKLNAADHCMFLVVQGNRGVGAWSATVTYPVNAFAISSNVEYVSLANGNVNHAPPNASWWAVNSNPPPCILFAGRAAYGNIFMQVSPNGGIHAVSGSNANQILCLDSGNGTTAPVVDSSGANGPAQLAIMWDYGELMTSAVIASPSLSVAMPSFSDGGSVATTLGTGSSMAFGSAGTALPRLLAWGSAVPTNGIAGFGSGGDLLGPVVGEVLELFLNGVALLMTVDRNGNAALKGSLSVSSQATTITSGSGAPSSTAPKGSLYLRTDGALGSTLYVSQNGSWNAVSGV